MNALMTSLKRGAAAGATASTMSAVALALLGKKNQDSPLGPINAVSHWIYGEKATRKDQASLKYTLPGAIIHYASATMWGVVFEGLFRRVLDRKKPVSTLEAAAATTAMACFVDYQLTPKRLTPGFEERLSKSDLAIVYAAFGIGLAAGALMSRK